MEEAAPGVGRVIPYQGIVEINGSRIHDTARFRFRLAGGRGPAVTELWESGPLDVAVKSGRFSVLLGQQTALPPEVFHTPELFLSVEIFNAETAEFILLSNAQRVVPVPYSYMATEAKGVFRAQDVEVAGELSVAGGVEVAGEVRASGVTAGQATATTLNVAQAATAGSLSVRGPTALRGNASVGGNTTVAGNTALNGNATIAGAATVRRNLRVEGQSNTLGNSIVRGNSTVQGSSTVRGNLTVNGRANLGYKIVGGPNFRIPRGKHDMTADCGPGFKVVGVGSFFQSPDCGQETGYSLPRNGGQGWTMAIKNNCSRTFDASLRLICLRVN